MPRILTIPYTGCIKKIEQILNRSQFCKKAFGIKFFTYADHLGTYDVEQ